MGILRKASTPEHPNDAMRLLVDALHSKEGGGRSFIRSQLQAWCSLPEAECDELLVLTEDDQLSKELTNPQIHWLLEPRRRVWVRFLYGQRMIWRAAKDHAVDAVYCPGNFGSLIPLGCPVVVTLQNPHYFARNRFHFSGRVRIRLLFERILSRASLRNCDLLVAISNSIATEARLSLNTVCRIEVIKSGCPSLPATDSDFELPMDHYILTVGNLYEHKAHAELLKACALAFPDNASRPPLIIVGNSVHKRATLALTSVADRTGYPVWWLRGLPRSDLMNLYAGATLYVSASHAEAYPLTPEEADTMGAAVVLSDIPAHREVLPRATFYPTGDVVAAAKALRTTFSMAISTPSDVPTGCAPKASRSWKDNARELRETVSSLIREGGGAQITSSEVRDP